MRLGILLTGAAILVVTGCTSSGGPTCDDARIASSVAGQRAGFAPALLFDRKPGWFQASDFAFRSDWPSTDAFYSPSQIVYFTERFVHIQGRRYDESDYSYRRFDTERVGVGY